MGGIQPGKLEVSKNGEMSGEGNGTVVEVAVVEEGGAPWVC